MRVQFLGVRGSTPAPGPDFVRYGGHTSCLAITAEGGSVPTLVLDAGTGLRSLTSLLDGAAFDGSIVLSHLHWDHVQGLPFFAAGDRDGARVDLYMPAQDDRSGRDLLARSFSPPSFPITPEGMHGAWAFHALAEGGHEVEGFTVSTVDIEHKGGRTYACGSTTRRAHWRTFPTTHPPPESPRAAGRCSPGSMSSCTTRSSSRGTPGGGRLRPRHRAGRRPARAAVRRGDLVLFHHSPARTDAALDEIAAWAPTLAEDLTVVVAVQDTTLDVCRPS